MGATERTRELATIFTVIDVAEGIGIDASQANIADCCAIAAELGRRKGIKASGRQIDPRKVLALLKVAL